MPDFVGRQQEKNTHFPTQLLSSNKAKRVSTLANASLTAAMLMRYNRAGSSLKKGQLKGGDT